MRTRKQPRTFPPFSDPHDTQNERKMNEGTANRTSKVRFSANTDTFSEEEEADIRHKRLLRYWYKGGRRYREAEKAFLNRVRIPSVGLLGDGETKVGWLRFFDPGGKNTEL